jgi:hypothetical protein
MVSNSSRRLRFATAVLFGIIAVAAVSVELTAMTLGPALHADSAAYIAGARNLAEGRGFSRLSGPTGTKPIIHYAPGFSLLLAGLQAQGIDAMEGARFVNAALFALNCVMVGVAVQEMTASAWAGGLSSILMLISPTMIELHSWAMSEPLYLFLGLLGCWLLSRSLRSDRISVIAASGIAIGLAFLTRYVGSTLVATAGLVILLTRLPVRRRLTMLAVFIATSLLPVGVHFARNWRVAGSLTNRVLALHPFPLSLLKRPLGVAWGWLVPTEFRYWSLILMLLLLAGVLAAAVVALSQRERRRKALIAFRQPGLSSVLAMYALIYGASILASISLFDAATPIDERTMSPVYVSLLALIVAGGWRLPRVIRWKHLRPALALAAAAVGVSFVLRSAGLLRSLSVEPRGYAQLSAQQGGGLPEITALPADVTIYTNNLDVLYFLYGRGGFLLPEPTDPITLESRDDYPSLMESVIDNVDRGAVVVMFSISPGEIDPLLDAGLHVDLERAGVILLSR